LVVEPPAWWVTLLTFAAFAVKTGFFILVFIWVRWTIPRFRYDQVMGLGWKVLIPLIVVYVAVLGGAMLTLEAAGIEFGVRYLLWLTGLNVVLLALVMFWLDRSRIVLGGAWEQARPKQIRSRG
jgi:NADH-quinone oxidoreductase subunit H